MQKLLDCNMIVQYIATRGSTASMFCHACTGKTVVLSYSRYPRSSILFFYKTDIVHVSGFCQKWMTGHQWNSEKVLLCCLYVTKILKCANRTLAVQILCGELLFNCLWNVILESRSNLLIIEYTSFTYFTKCVLCQCDFMNSVMDLVQSVIACTYPVWAALIASMSSEAWMA